MLLIMPENFGRNPFFDFQVIFCRLKILAECHHITTSLKQIIHYLVYFFLGFSEAKHDA